MATGGVDLDDSRPIMGGSSLFEPDDVAADDCDFDADGMDMITETKVYWSVYKFDAIKQSAQSADCAAHTMDPNPNPKFNPYSYS